MFGLYWRCGGGVLRLPACLPACHQAPGLCCAVVSSFPQSVRVFLCNHQCCALCACRCMDVCMVERACALMHMFCIQIRVAIWPHTPHATTQHERAHSPLNTSLIRGAHEGRTFRQQLVDRLIYSIPMHITYMDMYST